METIDRANLRLQSIKIARDILAAKNDTRANRDNWGFTPASTEEVIEEAKKILGFIEG